jgi:D-arabinose 1-dehydrogenase-like Zn-dependent alcohol dehydrogenase
MEHTKVQTHTPKYEHEIYKHQTDEKNADAFAWCFTSQEHFEKFPYKQPELGPNELRARMLYAGLCLSDSHSGRCKWGPANFPLAPGHENIGEVEAVGENVTDFKKGDKVAFGTMRYCCGVCKYCTTGKEPLCVEDRSEKFTYGKYWGGYSTHLQQPASHFFKIPEGMDLKRAAPLLCAGITVYNPIMQYLKPGMKTAVIGVGGLGHLAVKFFSKMGHECTGITTSMEKENFIRSLGATDVMTISDPEMCKKHFMQYDLIINTIPVAGNFDEYLKLVAKSGTMVHVGVPDVSEKITISPMLIVMNELKFVGSIVGSRCDINQMLDFCHKNDVYPIVEEFAFDDFDKALNRLENEKPIFRCVVDCGSFSSSKGL